MKPASTVEDAPSGTPDRTAPAQRARGGPPPPFIADLVFTLGLSLGTMLACLAAVFAAAALTIEPVFSAVGAAATVGLGGLAFVLSRAEDGRRWAVRVVAAGAYVLAALLGALTLLPWARIIITQRVDTSLGVVSAFLFVVASGAGYFAHELLDWERRLRSYRHDRRAECRRCGYDLRGNPGAVSCPECGASLEPRSDADQ